MSFTIAPGSNYTHSSSQITTAVYNHLDQLKEYYDVANIKLGIIKLKKKKKKNFNCYFSYDLVSMITQNYSLQSAESDQSRHKTAAATTKPIVVLSVLTMVGLLGTVTAVSAKLTKRCGKQVSGEKQPLIKDKLVHQFTISLTTNKST